MGSLSTGDLPCTLVISFRFRAPFDEAALARFLQSLPEIVQTKGLQLSRALTGFGVQLSDDPSPSFAEASFTAPHPLYLASLLQPFLALFPESSLISFRIS